MTDSQDALNYRELLKRAKSEMPEAISSGERFQIPEPDLIAEGKSSVFRNFMDIAEKLRRDPQHLLQYLLREMGTAGTLEGRRAVFKSKLNPMQVDEKLKEYTDVFVICSECGRPDTRMVKEGRILLLECEACGAKRPVHVKKTVKAEEDNSLKEGSVLEVRIEDVGSRGDGVARLDRYIIYIPGAQKGSTVKIRIGKMSGTIAFANIVQ
ncbi:MAG: translation initiation factor IF-2 subunit beta [Thermoplasmata archaeon]|jgi:translation initiation factor 2 subunit 2|nr:translation initiation factor IF-2 subunit beta [Candidatus Sysuiplasma jiujiangense]MBX8639527.1 translation initiation factor IF-2 subunit beta [Candidatus Sysuiplasma jiujiangense]MBX8641269.1 translation initiation factor IF-2 subunit beta [Candidatus Sysuiplasma jiujiangense]